MKKNILPLILLVMAGMGCYPPPVPAISPIPYVPPIVTSPSIPFITTQPEVKEYSLYIQNARILNVTDSTAILEFDTTIPSTAIVTLIAWEKEYKRYNLDIKSTFHSLALTYLNSGTPYTVIIEATGSKSDKTVLNFTTGTPIDISSSVESSPSFYYSYGIPIYTGVVDAVVLNFDGTFSGDIWGVSGFPNTVKQLTLTVRNGTSNQVMASFSASVISEPSGGNGKVILSGNNVIVPAYSNVNFQILATISGDAPTGIYGFGLNLFY